MLDREGDVMSDQALTVLLVDDNEDFLEQTRLQLEAAGYRVVVAVGQEEADRIVPETPFDVAVVDLMMEHHDSGFVVAYHIKKKDPSIPVILVTAVAAETGLVFDAATREERSWVHADVVLDKPVRVEQLQREFKRLIRTGAS